MVVPILKKIIVIFVLVLATVVLSSNAAQRARFVTASQDGENRYEEITTKISEEGKTVNRVHTRMMEMMNTDDYGRHDPSPSLAKPRYKLIPN